MQLFVLVNTLLSNDTETARKDLKIRGYGAIPLSSNRYAVFVCVCVCGQGSVGSVFIVMGPRVSAWRVSVWRMSVCEKYIMFE
jgi:hypothetical protein